MSIQILLEPESKNNKSLDLYCNSVETHSIETDELKINGVVVEPYALKYSSLGNEVYIPSISPTTVIYLTPLSNGIGSMIFTAFTAGKQLRIETIGKINSGTINNIVSYIVMDNGVAISSVDLGSISWTPYAGVRFVTIYNFINDTQAYCYSTFDKDGGGLINTSVSVVNFNNTASHPLDLAISAIAGCGFTHQNTTMTYS
jgi:hypothetical protein